MNKELIKECILKYGSPSYIFDLDALKERVLNIKRYWVKTSIYVMQ